jgi:hypothetical protein
LLLLEDCDKSNIKVGVSEKHFSVLSDFQATSYAQRYEILARKLMLEKKYNHAAFLMTSRKTGPKGKYAEPAKDVSMHAFLASLAGHVRVFLEGL